MFSTMDIALSGMNAATTRLNVAAQNIADDGSDNTTPLRANLTTAPGGAGVQVDSYSSLDGHPGDSLPTDLVALKTSQFLYDANAAVVRTSNEMLGTLIDTLVHSFTDRPSSDSP